MMDDTTQLAMLQSLSGRARPELPPEVRDWRPEPIAVPEPGGLYGFGPYDTPKVLAQWAAMAKRWAVPGMLNTAATAKRFESILKSPKTWGQVYETWELLMQLWKDGSRLLPVPWAWWRLKESPTLGVIGLFSPKVLSLDWKRAKFWDDHPHTFASRQRLLPKVTEDLLEIYQVATVTGLYDAAKWAALRQDEEEQRKKIRIAVQHAWTNHNLALWLGDSEEVVAELRLKKYAKAK